MTVVGLTGPTGAGKGVVARYLAQRGALIIDADRLAREVVMPGEDCLAALVAHFGDDILHQDGTLDRAALAAKAFADTREKAVLEAITHPAIIARSRDILQNSDADVAVIDAPLLFESGMDAMCDITLAVCAPPSTRLARIMARDGIDEAAATRRMNAQPDDMFYRARADHTILNDGDEQLLLQRLEVITHRIWEDTV